MTKAKKRVLAVYGIILIILGIATQAIPEVSGTFTKTEILQYETMRITDKAVCYFVRDEVVHMATANGNVNYFFEEGSKVRKNTKILDISPAALEASEESPYSAMISRLSKQGASVTQLTSTQNGVVSYFVDGYEGLFTPENMTKLKYEDIASKGIKVQNLTRANVYAGEPIFKICRNNQWYMIAWIDLADVSKYETGNNVTVELPKGNVSAKIENLIEQDDKWLVVLATNRYYKEFENIRKASANIVTQEYSGIKIRNSSIATKDGSPGVYIKLKTGEFSFKKIKIITSDGDFSLVKVASFTDTDGKEVDTVDVYDEILRNPKTDLNQEKKVN